MLKLAYNYSSELREAYQQIIFNDKYKYYNNGIYWEYDFSVAASSWNGLDFVSVDKDNKILGYLGAGIDRHSEKIDCLKIMNFAQKGNVTFSKDLFQFMLDLFLKFNYRKVDFSVVVGNPIEKMYDKYCLKYGGKIVGVKKENSRLQDGKYYDLKLYEIFRKDFIEKYENKYEKYFK